jgi:glycosyltransferase involved in cell wall biosynthesis
MPAYFGRATLAVSPLRYGAGIQNKVLEAMACAVPVVTTPNVCGALHVRPDRDLFVADSPDRLACHILNLIGDPDLRSQIGRAGRRYVEHHHHWPTIAQNVTSAYVAVQDSLRQRAPA